MFRRAAPLSVEFVRMQLTKSNGLLQYAEESKWQHGSLMLDGSNVYQNIGPRADAQVISTVENYDSGNDRIVNVAALLRVFARPFGVRRR